MNINLTNKLSALICGLILLPLTVFAQQQKQDGSGILTVQPDTYTTTANGVFGYGFYALSSGTIVGTDVTINTSGTFATGIFAIGTDTLIDVEGVTVNTTSASGIITNGGATIDLSSGAMINVDILNPMISAFLNGITSAGTGSVVRGTAITVETAGVTHSGSNGVSGVVAENNGFIDLGSGSRVIIHTRPDYENRYVYGVAVQRDGTLQGKEVTVSADVAVYANAGGKIYLTDSNLTGGSGGIFITENKIDGYDFNSEIIITGGILSVTDGDAISFRTATGISGDGVNSAVTLEGVTVNAPNGNLVYSNVGGNSNITLNQADTTNAGGIMVTSTSIGNTAGNTSVTVNGGSGINGDIVNSSSGSLDLNLNDSSVTGNIQNNSDGNLTLTGSNGSVITGDVTNSGDGTLNLGLHDSTLTGNVNNNNGTVSSTGSSSINGDVNSSLEVSSGTLTVTGSVTVDSGQSVTGNGTLTVGGLEINEGGTLGGGLTLGTDSASRILIGLSSATLYHEFGSLTEIGTDTLKLGENIALDLSGIDGLSGFTFAFTDEVQDGSFTLILGETGSLENWAAEINGNISGLTLSGQNEVTADITITLNGDGSALTATLSNVTVTAVPEPSTYFLIGTGLGLLLLTARCRRQAGTDA